MTSEKGELYQRFYKSYKDASRSVDGQVTQKNANKEWAEVKQCYPDRKEFCEKIEQKINSNSLKVAKKKVTLLNYFSNQSTKNITDRVNSSQILHHENDKSSSSFHSDIAHNSKKAVPVVACRESEESKPIPNAVSNDEISLASSLTRTPQVLKRIYAAPVQDETKNKIQALESQLNAQYLIRDSGLSAISKNDINITKKNLETQRRILQKKQKNAQYQQKFRAARKEKVLSLCISNNKATSTLRLRETTGRPHLEQDQPEILQAIIDIATFGGAAHDRRRTEEIRTCKTVEDLHKHLVEMGFSLSRSATYLRLLPKNSNSIEGRRHVSTVPVKLCKVHNDSHKQHPDGRFCTSSIRYLESLASLLGPKQVFFLSVDDKARVPIGLTAAQKQSPLLMHVEYKVTLPDHDWVIAERHKLIPSVYAGIVIKPQGLGNPEAVTYSGPTYIAIRSGKHDSSTAATHSDDFHRLVELENFQDIAKIDNHVKPIVVISADGGPDENPRFPKVIAAAIKHFKKYNLDAIFVVTNAPGRSAFNRVERRMAPLSKELSGLILRHDTYGTHLDKNGKTIDYELERKNFAECGKTLSVIWSDIIIDGHEVIAEYKEPTNNQANCKTCPDNINYDWYAKHVRESQYLLQVRKCKKIECCGDFRSDLYSILPNGFLPPPCLVQQGITNGFLNAVLPMQKNENISFLPLFQRLALKGLEIPNLQFVEMPYDFYCPSVQSQLENRVCKSCGLYFATKKSAELHTKALKHKLTSRESKKLKIVRIEAQRQNEVLCVIRDENVGCESAEWILEKDLSSEDITECTDNRKSAVDEQFTVIKSVSNWLQNPWTTRNNIIN